MCIQTAYWQGVEVKFFPTNVFCENGQIIVNHPINSDEYNDKFVPNKINLSALTMGQKERMKIINQLKKMQKKKENAKLKRS
ncbi:MAG: hypothetical protein EOM88_02870 [Clostridia bacterium]|nr:hypothetical protein [Clostridia bacterium]